MFAATTAFSPQGRTAAPRESDSPLFEEDLRAALRTGSEALL